MEISQIIRRYLPKSLLGRSIMIVVIPILAVQAIVAYIFIDRLYGDVTISKTTDVAREVNYVLRPDPKVGMDNILIKALPLSIFVQQIPASSPKIEQNALELWDISGRFLVRTLNEKIDGIIGIDLASNDNSVIFDVARDQDIYRVSFARGRASASNPHQLLVASTLAALLFLGLAIVFLKNQVKPISQLAKSAEAFGKGRKEAFAPRGAAEVRRAGHAFISMQSRIERQIDQRTSMLSGVSHDLRTPLTRMKLSLSMMDEDQDVSELQGDVLEMERIMEEFLAFARGDSGENSTEVNIKKFIKSLAKDRNRLGQNLEIQFTGLTSGSETITVKELALKRAVNNLLANAKRYANACQLTVNIQQNSVSFSVEDDGPGIPKASREDALLPFERLDASRNQNKGTGTGLGLAIAADIARSHGGGLELGHSQSMGGLKAIISIPR